MTQSSPITSLTIASAACSEVVAVPLRRRDGSIKAHALVDQQDHDRFGQRRWFTTRNGYVVLTWGGIGRCGRGAKGAGRQTYLHRLIMGCQPRDGFVVDHINGDRLDNRKSNLRVVTQQQNRQNVRGYGKYSAHRGVCFCKRDQRWLAYAQPPGGRLKMLGRYDTEIEAATVAAAFRAQHMPYAVER